MKEKNKEKGVLGKSRERLVVRYIVKQTKTISKENYLFYTICWTKLSTLKYIQFVYISSGIYESMNIIFCVRISEFSN